MAGSSKYIDKVNEQYYYAVENLSAIDKVVNNNSGSYQYDGKEGNKAQMQQIITNSFFLFIKRVLYMFAAFIIFTLIFRNVTYAIVIMVLYSSIVRTLWRTISSM